MVFQWPILGGWPSDSTNYDRLKGNEDGSQAVSARSETLLSPLVAIFVTN
jgi:hypothetical protein